MFCESASTSGFFDDFGKAFSELLPETEGQRIFAEHGPRGGGKPKLTGWQWLMARVYHAMAKAGSFATHVRQVTGVEISDSALSQRGQSIGWELLAEVLPAVLQPLAVEHQHPAGFHHGMRMVAFDGTRHNLRNTEAINAEAVKNKCSKGSGQPAFAHLLSVVLVELATHQPLGAALGWQGEGETTLARRLLEAQGLPTNSLVLADRLFGSPWLIHLLEPMLRDSGSNWLVRVKANLKAKRGKRLEDGSWLATITAIDPTTGRQTEPIRIREIHAEIRTRKNGQPVRLRFWTGLLDAGTHPAKELVELYATRWEEELFFRELKSHLHGRANLLSAQTPDTAAEEVLAMLLAAVLVARQRLAVAQAAGAPVLRISFAQVHQQTVALCQIFELGHDLIGPAQRAEWTRRLVEQLAATALIQKRRPRSCQRAVRQPVKDWPKMKTPTSVPLTKFISITNP